MIYGYTGTIHQTTELDVELGPDGSVVAVWFRCMALPFRVTKATDQRAAEMERLYQQNVRQRLVAVDLEPPGGPDAT